MITKSEDMISRLEAEMVVNSAKISVLKNYPLNNDFAIQARVLKDVNSKLRNRIKNLQRENDSEN